MADGETTAPKKKKWWPLITFTTLLVVCLGGLFFWWLFWGRFHNTTRDAYVHGNAISFASQVSGIVHSVNTIETDLVKEGQVLIELDDTDYKIAFAKAKAELGDTTRRVIQMFEEVLAYVAMYERQQAIVMQREVYYLDRKAIVETGAVSEEDYISAEASYFAAKSELEKILIEIKRSYAMVKGTTVRTHPLVREKIERLSQSYVNLKRCRIEAPVTGLVAERSVQVGDQISPGEPLLAIVPLQQMWVNANFKETHLKKLRIGQTVKMESDMYGSRVEFHGRVLGIGGGTGAVFSPLPPQNATGNWIKIVQRVPVRVSLSAEELIRFPLRLGLSMHVDVDVSDQSGERNPDNANVKPLFHTDIYEKQIVGVEQVVEKVFENNITYEPILSSEVECLANSIN